VVQGYVAYRYSCNARVDKWMLRQNTATASTSMQHDGSHKPSPEGQMARHYHAAADDNTLARSMQT